MIEREITINYSGKKFPIKFPNVGQMIDIESLKNALTGKLSADVPSYFDEVYYHSTRKEGGETNWIVQTVPLGRNHGRSRASGRERLLPDTVTNDYNEIIQYLNGTKKKPTKTTTTTK